MQAAIYNDIPDSQQQNKLQPAMGLDTDFGAIQTDKVIATDIHLKHPSRSKIFFKTRPHMRARVNYTKNINTEQDPSQTITSNDITQSTPKITLSTEAISTQRGKKSVSHFSAPQTRDWTYAVPTLLEGTVSRYTLTHR